jgi:monovalent cation:proton antiporter-2 (CPA2) family protein
MDSFLLDTFVYLMAAVIAVPLAMRFGLGSVLGYLLAGALIGPHVLNLVGDRAHHVMHFAEFGVVMMLFLVGLELQPSRLWEMRVQLFGLGGLQVFGTAAVVALIGAAAGLGFRLPFATGLILAMSSTAIVLSTLQERGLLKTNAGQASFAVLLFQDIAVIPILALLPLLAFEKHASAAEATGFALLPRWQRAALVLLAVAAVIAIGRHVVNPLFRRIARTGLRELFTAATLALVVGIALVMQLVQLSAALGTFVAGVVLANSEYRHEIEADLEPFKGLLLGLFFITVGANIDFHLLRTHPGLILGLVVALFAVKALVLLGLARVFRLARPDGVLLAIALAQGGEFAFVLLGFVVDQHVLTAEQASILVATVALSMAVAPLLFLFHQKVLLPRFARHATAAPARAADAIDAAAQENPVIIAGFGRFGHVIGRLLRANHIGTTVLDLDAEQVEIVRNLGIKVYYGDATRLDLLRAAGAERAKLIIIAIDHEAKAVELAATVQRHFPHLRIFARAAGRVHAYEFQKLGIESFYRETLGSSLDLGVDAMEFLGFDRPRARRAADLFKEHDERAVRDLAKFWEDDAAYFQNARLNIEAFEKMFESDAARPAGEAKSEKNKPG